MWQNPDKMTGLGRYHVSAIGRYNHLWSPLAPENTVGTGNLVKHSWDKSSPLVCNWWKSINSVRGAWEGQNAAGVQGQQFLL